jgi:LPXTG-motif cell wall-anchored protein
VADGSKRDADVSTSAAYRETEPVAVGTAFWALLFVIGLFIRPDLTDSGRGWWIWSAAAGVVLGLFGYLYLRRRRNRLLNSPRTPDPS